MAIALAAARLTGMQIVIVPRGSTVATAVAADEHDGLFPQCNYDYKIIISGFSANHAHWR